MTSDDRMLYAYIALDKQVKKSIPILNSWLITFFLGYTAKDSSFYASLYAKSAQQNQVVSWTEMEISNGNIIIEDRLVKVFFSLIFFVKKMWILILFL